MSDDGIASWQSLGVYDREDLETSEVYFLHCKRVDNVLEGHMWVGQGFLADLSINVDELGDFSIPEALLSR